MAAAADAARKKRIGPKKPPQPNRPRGKGPGSPQPVFPKGKPGFSPTPVYPKLKPGYTPNKKNA